MTPNARESFERFPVSAVRSNFNQRHWSPARISAIRFEIKRHWTRWLGWFAKLECACDWHPIFLRFKHPERGVIHAVFSRIEPVRKPYGSRSTCHCRVGLSNRSAVEKMAPKVAFA